MIGFIENKNVVLVEKMESAKIHDNNPVQYGKKSYLHRLLGYNYQASVIKLLNEGNPMKRK